MRELETLKRQHIAYAAVLVRDYDEAKDYYTRILGFDSVEDTPQPDGKRWVLLAPPGSREPRLLLAKASTPEQFSQIGAKTDPKRMATFRLGAARFALSTETLVPWSTH